MVRTIATYTCDTCGRTTEVETENMLAPVPPQEWMQVILTDMPNPPTYYHYCPDHQEPVSSALTAKST